MLTSKVSTSAINDIHLCGTTIIVYLCRYNASSTKSKPLTIPFLEASIILLSVERKIAGMCLYVLTMQRLRLRYRSLFTATVELYIKMRAPAFVVSGR